MKNKLDDELKKAEARLDAAEEAILKRRNQIFDAKEPDRLISGKFDEVDVMRRIKQDKKHDINFNKQEEKNEK